MKKRSFSRRLAALAVFTVVAAVIFFTAALVPLEKFLVDGLQYIFLGYEKFNVSEGGGVSQTDEPGTARIIMRRSDEYNSVLMINRGKIDGLESGAQITSGGTLIGFVETLGDRSSTVRIVSSPFVKIEGVFSRSGIPAAFEGQGAGMLKTQLPQGSDIQPGDAAVTQDESRLVIGRVVEIKEVASQPFVTVTILMDKNAQTLLNVEYGG